jgi:hypothetical protein
MANPTGSELRQAIALLSERLGYAKLHERLVRLNAFVSRRKPPTSEALADRLYALTAGLRRQVPATLAFHTVWSETFTGTLGEDNDKKLEALADRINATLSADERAVRDGEDAALDGALAEYEEILAGAVGASVARLDMLLKAVPPVAERLRARPPAPAAGARARGAEPAEPA